MIRQTSLLFIGAVLSSSVSCSELPTPSGATETLRPTVTLQRRFADESVTYLRFNTEEYQCIKIALKNAQQIKEICTFTDELGYTTDVRTDVSGVDYLNPRFTSDGLELTVDVSSLGPSAFYLDCKIPVNSTSVGEPTCTFRDMEH